MYSKYPVSFMCPEGTVRGSIWLTPEQADAIAFATDPDNWTDVEGGVFGGFHIGEAEE